MIINYKQEILRILKTEKKTFLWVFILINTIPILEMLLLYFIYLILDPTKRESNIDSVTSYLGINSDHYWASFLNEYSVQIIFIVAVCLLVTEVLAKFIQAKILVKQAYSLFMRDAKRVLYSYLYSDYETVKNISNEKLVNNILYDSGSLPMIIKESITIFSSVILIAVYTVASATVSLELSLVAVSIFVISFIINKKFFLTMKYVGQLKLKYNDHVLVYFSELLGGVKRIKLDSLESIFNNKTDIVLDKSQKWRIIKRMTEAKINITTESLSISSFLLLLYVGVYVLSVELGLMIMIFILFTRIRGDVNKIYNSYNRIIVFNQHVASYFDLLTNITTRNYSNNLERRKKYNIDSIRSITMENVSFSYGCQEVLNNINFKVVAGDRILVYGKSGEGKTTFIDIVTGLCSPTKGRVLYNNSTLDKNMFNDLRRKITYVSSDIYIFNDTAKHNIDLLDEASDSKLNFAVKSACLSDLINNSIKDAKLKVGSNGDKLSLGQRQRLILSRLFIKDSDLIVLDEPTSNLNSEMESEVIRNIINYINPNSILIVVSHNSYKEIDFSHKYKVSNKTIHEI